MAKKQKKTRRVPKPKTRKYLSRKLTPKPARKLELFANLPVVNRFATC